MAGTGLAWRDGVYGAPRRAPRAAGRAQARHAARDLLPHGLPERRGARSCHRRFRARPTLRATRAAATITRCCATGCRSSATASRRRSGEFGYRVFTDSAPVMEVELAARAGIGWRGKHTLLLSRDAGLVVLPRRDLLRPAPCPWISEVADSLRDLRALHRDLSDAGDPRALPARRAALHLLPDHRAQERDPRGAAAADRQPGLRLRRLPAGLPVEPLRAAYRRRRISSRATAWTARPWSSCSPGPRTEFDTPPARLADPPHRLRALAAQSGGRPGQCADLVTRDAALTLPGGSSLRASPGARSVGHSARHASLAA